MVPPMSSPAFSPVPGRRTDMSDEAPEMSSSCSVALRRNDLQNTTPSSMSSSAVSDLLAWLDRESSRDDGRAATIARVCARVISSLEGMRNAAPPADGPVFRISGIAERLAMPAPAAGPSVRELRWTRIGRQVSRAEVEPGHYYETWCNEGTWVLFETRQGTMRQIGDRFPDEVTARVAAGRHFEAWVISFLETGSPCGPR